MCVHLRKAEREQLAVVVEALGHDRVTITQQGAHKKVWWSETQYVTISSSPSDKMALLALRTRVRQLVAGHIPGRRQA